MIMSKMIYLFSAVLFLLLSFSSGLSLENLSSRQSLSSSKPYSTDRLLHELKDQMQNGRGAGVNLAEAQLSSKKKKSSNDLTVYMPKSESKEDSYSSGNGYYGNEESLGPAWDPLYSYNDLHSFRADVKRNKRARKGEQVGNNQELVDILKDDENGGKPMERERKVPPDVKRQESHHGKKKRQSDDPPMPNLKDLKDLKDLNSNPEQQQSPDFQDWLRKEYYRNMARSFASMRRKRAGWGPLEAHNNDSRPPTSGHRRIAKQAGPSPISQTKGDRFEEVTDNLKNIEDTLLSDALRIINENGGDYAEDDFKRNRITNDLNAAYDLETMRTALLHLKETLSNMEDDEDDDTEGAEYPIYGNYRKRGDQCPPLDLLTSDCSALSDVAEGPLKQLLLAACNWHEVCYTCGEAFGLTSDNCDVGFVEQSHTFCRGDVPCQTTAGLLLLPLRQRRVFYKRSNPSVCFVDPCVEEFLKQG